jgi:hypothetical protein
MNTNLITDTITSILAHLKAHNVMMSGFPWGPHKKNVQGRQQCPCGKGHDETVHHTFKDCTRSRRLHEMTLKQWREVTGETKIKASE